LISTTNRSAPRTGREFRLENFERDLAIVLEVLREIDRRHTPRAELALDAVAGAKRRCQAGGGFGHTWTVRRGEKKLRAGTRLCRGHVGRLIAEARGL
jgi:hypothetical protein